MKLLLKLTFALIATAILAAAIIFYITWSSNIKTLNAQTRERLELLATSVMDKVDRTLFERKADLEVMVSDPIISSRNSTPRQITKRLIEFRDIFKTYASLSFFDLNRVRIADTAGLDIGKHDTGFKQWEDVLQGKPNIASDIGISGTLGMPVIFFTSIVKDSNDAPFGVVVSRVPVDRLYEMLDVESFAKQIEDIRVDLLNRNGLLIYSNHNRKGILKDTPPEWELVKNLTGEISGVIKTRNHPDEEEFLLVFCHEQGYLDFKGNGWTLMIRVPTRIIYAPVYELRNKWLMIIIPGVILAIGLALFFTFKLSKPLAKLTNAVIEVGKGKLDTRVEIKSHDEIGELGKTFNRMAEELRKTTTSIDNLEHEIVERRKAENLLAQMNERKSAFIANVSHEIKNPLAAMRMTIENILDGLTGPINEKQKIFLEMDKKNIDRLLRLVTDLLDITRIEAGKMELKKEEVDMVSLVSETIEDNDVVISAKNIAVEKDFPQNIGFVLADRDKLKQVIINLLGNAIKYTPSAGRIVIRLSGMDNEIRFEISDNGPGISKGDMEKIFDKFERIFAEKQEGTGLGLSIANDIINLHKGKIWVESEPGKGSTFIFQMPRESTKE